MRILPRTLLRAAILIALLVVLTACSAGPGDTYDPYGDNARRIYELLIPIWWMALGVFVVVEGLLIYAIWRFRRRPGSTAMPAQVHGNTQVEILWTIAPAIIVLVIAVLTFRTQAANAVMPEDALRIKAIGHQWWFEFQYPDLGAEGKPLVTASDMYIPVGRPVTVVLESQDVIHNFWVPKLAGKSTYMIPGSDEFPDVYRRPTWYLCALVCAEFCGEAHALMRFRVIAVDESEFERWIDQKKSPPARSCRNAGGQRSDG
jgi:cytochrome c oxidase subunit 2